MDDLDEIINTAVDKFGAMVDLCRTIYREREGYRKERDELKERLARVEEQLRKVTRGR